MPDILTLPAHTATGCQGIMGRKCILQILHMRFANFVNNHPPLSSCGETLADVTKSLLLDSNSFVLESALMLLTI